MIQVRSEHQSVLHPAVSKHKRAISLQQGLWKRPVANEEERRNLMQSSYIPPHKSVCSVQGARQDMPN